MLPAPGNAQPRQYGAPQPRNEADFCLLFAHNPLPMWVYDLETLRFLEVNEAAVTHYGYTREEFLAMTITDIRPPADVPRLLESVAQQQKGTNQSGGGRHVRKDGQILDVDITSRTLQFGGRSAVLVVAYDMTERHRVARLQAQLAAIVESSDDAITGTTLDGTVTNWNPGAQRLYGYAANEIIGKSISLIVPPDRTGEVEEILERIGRGERIEHLETVRLCKDRRLLDVSITVSPIKDDAGNVVGSATIGRDMTDHNRTKAALQHQALHDALTQLPNRTLVLDRLQQAIRTAQRDMQSVGLLLMDLDRFKEINDTLGHHRGDLLLQQVATRMDTAVRATDTVGRLGGDEFAIILPTAAERDAVRVAEKILGALDAPFRLEEQLLHCGASIGIALHPQHGDTANTLLQRADVAMYLAKRAANTEPIAVYAPENDPHSPERLRLVSDLARGIEHRHLTLHYQPKVDLKTRRVPGMEALARWHHADRGFVPPDQFIPLAEQTGLIKPLTHWAIREALLQCRLWYDAGCPTQVAVNLSVQCLRDPTLVDTVGRILRRCAASPTWLEVEITESTLMADADRAMAVLTDLHAMGVRISIDDFGTGYSSLAYLKHLPVDAVKIDRSFIRDLSTNPNDVTIARTIVELGHSLGLEVIAEGVEDDHTAALLTAIGCDQAQGYYFSKPVASAQCTAWLHSHRTLATAG